MANTRKFQPEKLDILGDFAAGLAHDVNNILSFIEAEAQKALPEGPARDKIMAYTQRGAGLTRQLLAFSAQKVAVEDTLDLCRLLREQEKLLKPLLGEGIQLTISLPEDPLWIRAAHESLAQIIINLCLNAKEAMNTGGTVTITAAAKGNSVVLTIADTGGQGISPDILPRIFDPFFTTKPKSRGMGLSIVHGLVKQLRGTIEITSKQGQGTRLDLSFPRHLPVETGENIVDMQGKPVNPAPPTPKNRVNAILDRARNRRGDPLTDGIPDDDNNHFPE